MIVSHDYTTHYFTLYRWVYSYHLYIICTLFIFNNHAHKLFNYVQWLRNYLIIARQHI